jgi:hypothetical protein
MHLHDVVCLVVGPVGKTPHHTYDILLGAKEEEIKLTFAVL